MPVVIKQIRVLRGVPASRRSRERRGRERRSREQGSALLVVLVLAAIIAIMLYRELPIAAFEAQRQKEQLLVSRGNQYKRAVKLFVRKIGRFPSSIDELESTNRMRFLRHRFVDPLTGKDDWRLIHAGPGGIILDSKVPSTTNNPNASALGQGAVFAGFNNSFTGDTATAAANAAETAVSAGLRQRPPATKNAGSGLTAADPLAAAAGTAEASDPNNPNSTNASTGTAQALNVDPTTGQPLPNNTGSNGVTSLADQLNNTNPRTPEQAPTPQNPAANASQNPAQTNPLGNTSSFGNTTSFGNSAGTPGNNQTGGIAGNQGPNQMTAGGGIAGVASNAEGKGIKLVQEQKKYKLWEFYYDMRKEQQAALGTGQAQNPAQNGNGAAGSNNGALGGTQSSFGSASPTQPNASGGTQAAPVTQPSQPQ